MRNLLIFVLILAGIWWIRRALSKPRSDASQPGQATGREGGAPERMVACAHCGIHVPESESVQGSGGAFYCCDEHRRLGSDA